MPWLACVNFVIVNISILEGRGHLPLLDHDRDQHIQDVSELPLIRSIRETCRSQPALRTLSGSAASTMQMTPKIALHVWRSGALAEYSTTATVSIHDGLYAFSRL